MELIVVSSELLSLFVGEWGRSGFGGGLVLLELKSWPAANHIMHISVSCTWLRM